VTGLEAIRAAFAAAEAVPPLEGLDPRPPDPGSDPPPDPDPGPGYAPEESGADARPIEAECAALPLNDLGNGKRFVAHFGRDVIRVPRFGFCVWTGKKWQVDEEDTRGNSPGVRRLAQQISPAIERELPFVALPDWQRRDLDGLAAAQAEVKRLEAEEEPDLAALRAAEARVSAGQAAQGALGRLRAEHRRFAKSTGNSGKIDSMLKEAAVDLIVDLDRLDAEPLAVNCQTGLLRFSVESDPESGMSKVARVECIAHAREHYATKIMPVAYEPGAPRPRFDAFLARIQPDPDMRAFLQRWFGLSMTALTFEQKLAFLHGAGANGKSVLVDTIARVLGDYATTAKIESLTGTNRRGGGDATPDLIPLIGARMVRASEPEEGARLQEGLIKEMTGGEPILVRQLHADFVEVTPQFKATLSGNHKPDIRGTDDGIWRRVLLVPFDQQIPEAERDPGLPEKLWQERDGIFDWLVEGLLAYLEGGLAPPAAVTDATREYREESDPVGAFLAECCEVRGEEGFTEARALVEAFHFWLAGRGEGRWTDRTVALRLKDKAGRWRDPRTGQTFQAVKRSRSGYSGIAITEIFQKRMQNETAGDGYAPRGGSSSAPDPGDF
jgi:putative DNA primase/helicase